MKIVTVKMTKDEKGCPDGLNTRLYKKDKTYDLPEDLANCFLNELECSEIVIPEKVSVDSKDDLETPEDKPNFLETPETQNK